MFVRTAPLPSCPPVEEAPPQSFCTLCNRDFNVCELRPAGCLRHHLRGISTRGLSVLQRALEDVQPEERQAQAELVLRLFPGVFTC